MMLPVSAVVVCILSGLFLCSAPVIKRMKETDETCVCEAERSSDR